VTESEPGLLEREGRAKRAFEQTRSRVEPVWPVGDERQGVGNRDRSSIGIAVSAIGASRRVVGLGAVRQRVHCGPDCVTDRERERQGRVVDRSDGLRQLGAATPLAARREEHPVERRPLSPCVRGRHGDRPQLPLGEQLGRHRLAGVDGAPAAKSDETVYRLLARERGCRLHGLDGNVGPDTVEDRIDRQAAHCFGSASRGHKEKPLEA
jgi:hypothetical protein